LTQREKLNKLEAFGLIRENVGRCFGDQDMIFRSYKSSRSFVRDLLELAFDEGLTLTEWEELIFGYFTCTDIQTIPASLLSKTIPHHCFSKKLTRKMV